MQKHKNAKQTENTGDGDAQRYIGKVFADFLRKQRRYSPTLAMQLWSIEFHSHLGLYLPRVCMFILCLHAFLPVILKHTARLLSPTHIGPAACMTVVRILDQEKC